MDKLTNFLHALSEQKISNGERAVALLWWYGRDDHNAARSPSDIADDMKTAGYASQNISRLRKQLEDDRRTAKAANGCFRVRITARASLDDSYSSIAGYQPIRRSDSVLPSEIFSGSRGYIEKVVAQLNASYDAGLYDCCAVMCRRLAETLLIEAYEAIGKAATLKDNQDHFLMFSGLLAIIEKDNEIGLSRSAIKGLKDFKALGDLSAHNRRFNARQDDVDRVRDGLRIASEELLKIAHLVN